MIAPVDLVARGCCPCSRRLTPTVQWNLLLCIQMLARRTSNETLTFLVKQMKLNWVSPPKGHNAPWKWALEMSSFCTIIHDKWFSIEKDQRVSVLSSSRSSRCESWPKLTSSRILSLIFPTRQTRTKQRTWTHRTNRTNRHMEEYLSSRRTRWTNSQGSKELDGRKQRTKMKRERRQKCESILFPPRMTSL